MAINPETQYAGKIAPATAAYPYGEARNITLPGDGTGTPWEAALVNDIFGFQQSLLSESGIVPTGDPEQVGASQYLRSMKTLFSQKVDFVADMVAKTELAVGDFVTTKNYKEALDGGSNTYEIVAGGTGTADGGLYIDLDNGLQARGLFESGIAFAAQYGAVGDGSDEYPQLKNLNLSGFGTVVYDRRTYVTSDTVPFASKTSYYGIFDETIIQSSTDAKPIGASQAWLSSEGVSPAGREYLRGLHFVGLKTNLSQKGFVLHDYYSTLDHVSATNCGGGGIQLTQQKDDATPAAGTLVENRLVYPIVRNCGGTMLDLGEADNNKLTDGFMEGAILQGEPGLTTQHLFCGSTAGWQIDGTHFYGSASSVTALLRNCNNTRFTNFFMEAFEDRGVSAESIQGDTVISGHFNADSANVGARVVNLGKSGAVDDISVEVDIGVSLDVATADIDCVYNEALEGDIRATIRTQGAQKELLNLVSGTDATRIDQVRIMADATVYGKLKDSPNAVTSTGLSHTDKRLAYGFSSGRLSGTSAKTVTIPVKIPNFGKLSGTITIEANSFDNGGNLARFHGMFFVSAKTNGTDAWTASLTSIIAPTGFSAAPAITASNTVNDDGTIDITFTFNDAAATGVCTVVF